jgi:hypothetical protein
VNAKSGDRSYKRSWKNLLINKRYQLRFTLFMVGLSSLLMVGLGVWVMRVANETTEIAMTSERGKRCVKAAAIEAQMPDEQEPELPRVPMRLDEPAGDAPPAAPSAEPPAPPDEPRRIKVQIDESSMTLSEPAHHEPLAPPVADPAVLRFEKLAAELVCGQEQAGTFAALERGRVRILWAMILTGIALVLGLAIYGIKMTHRVAGPLFKVSLYLSKMRGGRYDKVYNLRKGDQLIEFYDHFKAAHGGVVAMQRDDIARLAEVIAAAEAAGAGGHPAVAELRELLARKEKSIE